MSDGGWSAYLDDLESSVLLQRSLLSCPEEHFAEVAPVVPPADLQELPPTLRARASRAVADLAVLARELQEALDKTGRQLSTHRRLVGAPSERAPSYVDGYS